MTLTEINEESRDKRHEKICKIGLEGRQRNG